jgi:hypothetical protein
VGKIIVLYTGRANPIQTGLSVEPVYTFYSEELALKILLLGLLGFHFSPFTVITILARAVCKFSARSGAE